MTLQEIKNCIEEDGNKEISDDKIKKFVEVLIKKYDDEKFSFEIIKLANGYQFLTKSKYIDIAKTLLKQHSDKRLSIASLETLAIIAYKQPIIKSEIEQIRGVNCDYTINKLLEKNLIEIKIFKFAFNLNFLFIRPFNKTIYSNISITYFCQYIV